uniref:Fungal-type protein kinase domain-containing protein n=1 Tax=Ganoderma boninense TaxID=34458 RepID=A0A5K1JUQ0_9APHY|nr:Uncharacterized protein [Ganoderma boninense]
MSPGVPACVYDVPLALDNTFSHTRGLDPRSAAARNDLHLHDCIDHLLGPMPPQQFLDFFLPWDVPSGRKGRLQSRNAFKDVPLSWNTVDDMYAQLLPALNKQTPKQARCPGFVFEVAASRSIHPNRPGYMKPDICCYASGSMPIIHSSDHSSRVELGHAELFIDLKPHPLHDFFVDPPSNIDQDTRRSHEFLQLAKDEDYQLVIDLPRTLGQHVAFVTEILARQFRTFLFSISMSGSFARILRWDRSGCVTTESFNIREHPDLLCEFLWRFSQTSNAGRGHDPTVQLASAEEEVLFQDVVLHAVRVQLEGSDVVVEDAVREHYAPGRVYAMNISCRASSGGPSKTRRYLVSCPVISPLSFVGRGTRGYWTVDVVSRSIAFLKDTWRFASVDELEADTLQRLQNLGVRHVPRVPWFGDVCDGVASSSQPSSEIGFQETLTNKMRQAPWACQVNKHRVRISRRRHHRLVLETVGYGLSSVRGPDELLSACYDVFIAMQDARKLDSRIHRDISLGNIILVKIPGDRPTRQGYLIDWEASCAVDDKGEAQDVGRAGTWRFMSIRMLNADGDNLKQTFQDDMEALFYVVLFCALMYQPHNRSPGQLKNTLNNFFDEKMSFGPGVVGGGNGKTMNSLTRTFTRGLQFESPQLGEWINAVADLHHAAEPVRSSSEENSNDGESENDYQDRWSDPKYLDDYWATFLKTHKLEHNNRFEQEIISYLEDESPPPLIFPNPPSSPLPSIGPLSPHGTRTSRKRPLPVSSDDARGTKRNLRSGHRAPSSTGTRHSARLEEKMKREVRERGAEKKRKQWKWQSEGHKKSKNAKRVRRQDVGSESAPSRTARGGVTVESTKRSSTRLVQKCRADSRS